MCLVITCVFDTQSPPTNQQKPPGNCNIHIGIHTMLQMMHTPDYKNTSVFTTRIYTVWLWSHVATEGGCLHYTPHTIRHAG